MHRYCKHADHEYKLVRMSIANGTIQVKKLCRGCGQPWGDALKHEAVDMADLALYDSGYRNPGCARCGDPDTELHHYFPQSLARQADENPDEWPAEYLCARHHGMWHDAVTPKLVTRKWTAPKPERTNG